MSILFPQPLAVHALTDTRSRIALNFDLPLRAEEIYLPIVSDAGKDHDNSVVIGYAKLRRLIAQQPGLATFSVVALRSANDPPLSELICERLLVRPRP